MHKTIDIHNQQTGIIEVVFWRFPGKGEVVREEFITDCGYVALTQKEGFVVDAISIGVKGELRVDVWMEPESGGYVTELKDFTDSTPPFKCLRIQAA